MHKRDRLFHNIVDQNDCASLLSFAHDAGDWRIWAELGKRPQELRNRLMDIPILDKGLSMHPLKNILQEGTGAQLLIINAAEGFMGHWKDRMVCEWEPHKVWEGALLLAKALDVQQCCVVVHGQWMKGYHALMQARQSLSADKVFGSLTTAVRLSNGVLSCAQDRALLRHLEGHAGVPTGEKMLYNKRVCIVNVETCASVAPLIQKGVEWVRKRGGPHGLGTRIFTIAGDVQCPSIFEDEYGVGLMPAIERYAGGPVGGWKEVQCIFTDGFFGPPLSMEACQKYTLDELSAQRFGTTCRAGSIIVCAHERSLLMLLERVLKQFEREGCGVCLGCREGVSFLRILLREEDYKREQVDRTLLFIQSNTQCFYGKLAIYMVYESFKKRWVWS